MNLQATDFELFNLPQQFALNRADLDARWKALQQEVHPDKFTAAGSAAQRVSMQYSVRVNEAFNRLKDPLSRAAYLCELAGHPVNAHSNTAMPASFLMQQMDLRERLESAETEPELNQLADEAIHIKDMLLHDVARQLDVENDAAAASQTVRALMFIEKLSADIDDRVDALMLPLGREAKA